MIFYAKSDSKLELDIHTRMVKEKFEDLLRLKKEYFSNEEIAMIMIACHYHDIGKINTIFQERIINKRTIKQIPHGYLSILLMDWKDNKELLTNRKMFKVVLNAVYFHHRRENYKHDEIIDFSIKYLQENANAYFGKEVRLQTSNLQIDIYDYESNCEMVEEFWYQYVIVKGILNKCDWSASGNLEIEISAKESINKNIKKQFSELRPLQKFMKNHSN